MEDVLELSEQLGRLGGWSGDQEAGMASHGTCAAALPNTLLLLVPHTTAPRRANQDSQCCSLHRQLLIKDLLQKALNIDVKCRSIVEDDGEKPAGCWMFVGAPRGRQQGTFATLKTRGTYAIGFACLAVAALWSVLPASSCSGPSVTCRPLPSPKKGSRLHRTHV
jgi:hypothetical protein